MCVFYYRLSFFKKIKSKIFFEYDIKKKFVLKDSLCEGMCKR